MALVFFATPITAQELCRLEADLAADAGWAAYADGRIDEAGERFRVALEICATQLEARIGRAYVLLRQGSDEASRQEFSEILVDAPDRADVVTGLGLLAWRRADLQEVAARFSRVLELVPDDPTALAYLSRLPRGTGPAPERPPLVVPDTLEYPSRVQGEHFEIRGPTGWEPFWIKGVNLGAALPGRFPSQFPDSTVYAGWIREMAAMGANTVRVYTIHPPDFYEALADFNRESPDSPLWVIHGVWTGLPPGDDFLDPEWEGEFFAEMRRVVDVLHGRADLRPRPGHASGFYTADVSEWALGYIIGREWESYSVVEFNAIQPDFTGWDGRFVSIDEGTPMEAWLAKALDELVAYETDTYGSQRPAAYTNWPTLDPMYHPTESTTEEEVAIRRLYGEEVEAGSRQLDNDGEGLDATKMRATEAFEGGVFASFHAYPYYPDLMVLNERYRQTVSSFGPSAYFGYLRDLQRYHAGMPVVVAEYGVPASLGNAHLQPDGLHHGGHTEASMAEANRRMTIELAEAGLAGGILFAWIDEWFKQNWLVAQFEQPRERNRFWLNRLDAEQHYGVKAIEAVPPVAGDRLEERLQGWQEIPPLYEGEGGRRIRAASDAAYLWLLVEEPGLGDDAYRIGFDLFNSERGDFRWPGPVGERLPVGIEFALVVAGDEARVLVDPPQNPFRLVEVGQDATRRLDGETWPVDSAPVGLFQARAVQLYNLPYLTVANDDGQYDSLRVITNRRRFGRDGTEYLGTGYDRGVLPSGELPDGFWQRLPGGGFEVRIPWLMINVTDPSSRTVLQGPGENRPRLVTDRGGASREVYGAIRGAVGTEQIEGIGIVAGRDGTTSSVIFPAAGQPVSQFTWDTWQEPEWRSRPRPTFEAMRSAFGTIRADGSVPTLEEAIARRAQEGEMPERPETFVLPPPPVDSANVAWQAGDLDNVIRLYGERLETDPIDEVALHRMALAYAWTERYDESIALFDRLLATSPRGIDARIDRARVFAWKGDLASALEGLDEVLDVEPTNATALSAAAQFQAWAGQNDASLATYEQLLAIDPDDPDARRGQARTYSWSGRFDEARAVYEELLRLVPDDVDARVGLARILTFSNRFDEALEAYDEILQMEPGRADALQGRARTLTWSGKLVAGEDAWRRAVQENPNDLEAMVGLGQNLRWQGRNGAARDVLEAVRTADPTNESASEQLRWVYAATGPQMRPSVVYEGDSDDNRMFTTLLSAQWHPVPALGLRVNSYRRFLEQGTLEREAQGVDVVATLQLEPGWRLSAGLGGSENDGDFKDALTNFSAALRTPARRPVVFGFGFSRYALDATALLAQKGVQVDQYSADMSWVPARGWRFSGSGGFASYESAQENERWTAAASLRKRFGGGLSLGLAGRTFEFDEDLAISEGYFDPELYRIGEFQVGLAWNPGRVSLTAEAAPGLQQVGEDGDARATVRFNGGFVFRISPGREISLYGGYSSTGLNSFSTSDSDYRYTAAVFSINWVFGS
jgi:tetratricopeptide (TPR) repeat protein